METKLNRVTRATNVDFFQPNSFKINFFIQEHYQSVKDSVRPDLGPNCLQRLSEEDKSSHVFNP